MLSRLRSIAAALFRRDRFERAMTDELQFHVDVYAADLEREGLPPAEAMRRARIAFGNVDTVKQDARQSRGLRLLDETWQDVRYAARLMRQSPGFTAAAVLSLGLGIGANTAIFSLIDALMWRVLPVERPGELWFLAHGSAAVPSTSSNYPLYDRYRQAPVFSGVTAYRTTDLKVHAGESIELVSGQYVSGNYHAVVKAPIARGRGFVNETDRGEGTPIAVISDAYWTRKFGRAADILEKTVSIRGTPVPIVGVTAPGFVGLVPGTPADITLPLSMYVADSPSYLTLHSSFMGMPILARLGPGVTDTQALAVVDPIFQQFMSEPENAWAREGREGEYDVARLLPAARGSSRLRREYGTSLQILMAMVALVLLIASANVANLLLARSTARAKEVAIRACVGGGRARLIRQFLTESALLAIVGGALGVWFAMWGTEFIVALLADGPQRIDIDVAPNARVLGFTAGVALLTGLAFGLVPALRATRVDLAPALKENGIVTRSTSPIRRWVLGNALVAGQLALCVVVVAIAALLARSVYNLKSLDVGFNPEGVITLYIDAFGKRVPRAQLQRYFDEVIEGLGRLPGVESAAGSTSIPVHTSGNMRPLHMPHLPDTPEARGTWVNPVTPAYFETMGIAIKRGRAFTAEDREDSLKVAIVNETTARYLFGDADPIGRPVMFRNAVDDQLQIVGVAADTHQTTLRQPAPRMVYKPLTQEPEVWGHLLLSIRARDPRRVTAEMIRSTVRGVTTDLVADDIRTMTNQIDGSLVRERTLMALSTAFAVLALVLACVGLYGVMSYQVTRRTREIGIRFALGAGRARVLAGILWDVLRLSVAGLAVGAAATWFAAKTVSAFLFALSPRDPITLAGVCAALLVTTILAGYLPAWRAATIDPARAIRNE
jgi:predicted permease